MLDEYENWVNKDIPLDDDWDEELNYLAYVRSEIHSRSKNYTDGELKKIRNLDVKLQRQFLNNSDSSKNFIFSYPRTLKTPRNEWWAWLDQLDDLTDEEKATI